MKRFFRSATILLTIFLSLFATPIAHAVVTEKLEGAGEKAAASTPETPGTVPIGCCKQLKPGISDAGSDPNKILSCVASNSASDCTALGSAFKFSPSLCEPLAECAGRSGSGCCRIPIDAGKKKCVSSVSTEHCSTFSSGVGTYSSKVCTDAENAGLCGFTTADVTPTKGQPAPNLAVPKLSIDIPGVSFAALKVQDEGGKKYIDVPYLAQYIQGIYTYVLGLVGTLAVVMIIIGGVKYVSAAGDSSRVSSAKETIGNALIGFVLALGSYFILSTINPAIVNLKPIRVDVVQRELYTFYQDMDNGNGFKDPGSAAFSEAAAQAAYANINGGAELVGEAAGETVSIDGINPTGKPYEKLRAFCTKPADAAKLQTYDDKINALVRVALGFARVCVKEKGCTYVRGGFTNFSTGTVQPGASDIPFLLTFFQRYKINEPMSDDCKEAWQAKTGGDKKVFYKNRKNADFSDFEFVPKIVTKDTLAEGQGKCWIELVQRYRAEYTEPMSRAGLFGGDCGTTLIAMYQCAGGGAKSVSELLAFAGKDPSQYIVYAAKNRDDVVAQAQAHGGLRFGDIFTLGSNDWQHNFMFTGGREDVPFSYLEMGSSGGDGVTGAQAVIPGTSIIMGGMATHSKESNFFYWDKPKAYPLSVFRPYDLKTCATRTECGVGESCHCTAGDVGFNKNRMNDVLQDKCSMAKACHKAKGAFCQTNEQCPNGTTCKNTQCSI